MILAFVRNPPAHEDKPSKQGRLLKSPDSVSEQLLKWCRSLPAVRAGHDLPASRQPCERSPQPLVDVSGVDVLDAYEHLGILPARRLVLRSGVARRLSLAEKMLPNGLSLVVLDAWRSPDEQQALVDHYGDGAAKSGFVAQMSDEGCRPPHTTGGAVDLTLSYLGKPLALGTDYDSFRKKAAASAFEEPGSDGRVRLLRRGFVYAMSAAGFVSYEKEWWHWSYGDDVWAQATRRPALYDIVECWPAE